MLTQILQNLYPWIDTIWLPIAFVTIHKHQRVWALGYIIGCMIMMRMQSELMVSIGYPYGLLPLIDMHVFTRGLIVYSGFHAVYLLLTRFSRDSNKHVLMAASISIFFAAMFVSMIIMLL
ncbi:MAG: hypothetical protein ACRBCT_05910 [Alphaproteobacteria bacterium]